VYVEEAIWYFFCFAIAVRPILQYVLAPLTGWPPGQLPQWPSP